MSELSTSPAFETALRTALGRLADSAPVPDAAHLDALEARTTTPIPRSPRNRRPLALIAAVVLVIAGIVGGAVALRDGDGDIDRTQLNGGTTTSATTTVPVGPLVPARKLSVSSGSLATDDSSGSQPTVGMINAASDTETLVQLWAEAGLPASARPAVDFGDEVVVELVIGDDGCPSDDLEFRKVVTGVRALLPEPASCPDPSTATVPRTYFYALRWADTGRPFTLELAQPGNPSSIGSIPVG